MTDKLRAIVEGRRCDCGCGCIVEFPTNAEKVLAQALIDVIKRLEARKEAFHEGLFARDLLSTVHTKLKEIE